jgi:hypothetical protein
VLDSEGKPVFRADVTAHSAPARILSLRMGVSDPDGLVTLDGLPIDSSVAWYAHAPGHAWARGIVDPAEDASSPAGILEVRLEPGLPIEVIVEDAQGMPIPGVLCELQVEDGGTPPTEAPEPVLERTSLVGMWMRADLPLRSYALTLTREGFRSQVLHSVRPGPTTYYVTMLPAE